jgi:superfamily II DNA/RNA helicase
MTEAFEARGEAFSPDFASAEHDFAGVDASTSEEFAGEAVEASADSKPNPFAELGLAPELLSAIADLGYTAPTPVQIQTIPLALPSRTGLEAGAKQKFVDLMVSSQTGSGKTAAFLLPVLHTLLVAKDQEAADEAAAYNLLVAEAAAKGEAPPKRAKRQNPTLARNFKPANPGALILCPTRELAQQVAHDAIGLVKYCRGLRVATVMGGMPYQMQLAKLHNADLVVATPGRLLDLQRSFQIKLDKVKFLVVDEADRMLDLGFSEDLAEVNQLTMDRGQTMMFSATFAPRIQQLARQVMREPRQISIDTPQERHQNIKQKLLWADNATHKRELLDHCLRDTTISQAIVFASTQVECDGLANDLQQAGFSAVALHGALSQALRNRRLMALRTGHIQFLVATDVAARGIDVPSISHVFNYGLPMKAEDYTHRIGRTGRAGRDGIAITFAEVRDRRRLADIEDFTRSTLPVETIPGMEPRMRFPAVRPTSGGGRGGRPGEGDGRRTGNFGGGGFGGGASRGGFAGGGRPPFEGRERGPQEFRGRSAPTGGGRPFESRDRAPTFDRAPSDRSAFERSPYDRTDKGGFNARGPRTSPSMGSGTGFGAPDRSARPAGAPQRPARSTDRPFERNAAARPARPAAGGRSDRGSR